MQISSNILYDIGSNYSIKLKEGEYLVYEDDETGKTPDEAKLQKKQEKAQEGSRSKEKLSPDEERLVRELQSRDSEVRSHESAHQAAGGGMTGAASFTYRQGPDGKMYAIGGEVSISMQSGSSPEETLRNARQIAAAAMAAGNPSPQDYSVASSAKVMEMKALQQLAKEQQAEMTGKKIYKNEADKTIL
ncbi:hypothetical protein KKG72_11580 [bacterium]|nr:hypothetical protein [bacterium]MBU1994725.1 hypothetical protein [bacterium]